MDKRLNVATVPKTSTFQMRIKPEIKAYVEDIYANCGMTLTDAVNAFIQQSINVEGLPFLATRNSKDALKEQAVAQLLLELRAGEASTQSGAAWVSEEDALKGFGVL